ncbi:hypothetical protein [Aureliella helgolandensis]|uniref:hypothetical protein n=1 Tax=Aureliella helgolandensis TaxID=2527968 RepID=UPI001E3938D8|nr:hypothetical protein [Aureliella helgolandensis]
MLQSFAIDLLGSIFLGANRSNPKMSAAESARRQAGVLLRELRQDSDLSAHVAKCQIDSSPTCMGPAGENLGAQGSASTS